jgi:hypothetical protein
MNVARVERGETRGLRPVLQKSPDCAEFIIGRAFRATGWLHPGYQLGADLAEKLL